MSIQTRLQRFAHIFLFIFFEIIAFVLVVNFNQKQKDIFQHSLSLFTDDIVKRTGRINDYLSLQQSNEDLLNENARLLNEIINMPRPQIPLPDTTEFKFSVIPARVIKNSIVLMRNEMTIDKGAQDGIRPSMGVATSEGIIGIVSRVNQRYATILSLLNLDTRISASVEGENFFGTISWNGRSHNSLSLSGIPIHADISIGNLVRTNGYSTIFPPGLKVGVVKSYDYSKDGAFYEIELTPTIDLSNLEHVYILKDNFVADINSIQLNE